MKTIDMSWRLARRELRSGELQALAAALVIAVAALAAVAAFSQRVEAGLKQSANELLGGDLVAVSRYAMDPGWDDEARDRGLDVARAVEFPTVAFSDDASMLVQVKAVTGSYPLRGRLEVADGPAAPAYVPEQGPAIGEAWVDSRVLGEMGLAVGAPLELGDVRLEITRVLRFEPDRTSVFELAPRVLVRDADIAGAGLLGEGSRAQYRFMVAGERTAVTGFREWLDPRRDGAFFQSLERSQRQISEALSRAERFLSLAALSAVLLAGAALVIAVRQFSRRHFDTVAVLRCLGASQRETMTVMSLELLWVAIPSILLGIVLGYGAQFGLVAAMGDLIPDTLPLPGLAPAGVGVLTGLLALFGFGLPPLAQLRLIPPARVLRRQLTGSGASWVYYLAPALLSMGLVFLQARDVPLALAVIFGLLGTLGILAGVAAIVVWGLRRLPNVGGVGWRYGLANVGRRRASTLFQVGALGFGALMIFLLSVVQADLLRSWRADLPENAPNYFLINIQPEQRATVAATLAAGGLETAGLEPLAVGKIAAVNGEAPREDQRRLDRTLRVSWADELPPGNEIVQGGWWSNPTATEVSLEQEWAFENGLALGDELTFEFGAQTFTAEVTSIRAVDWDSFEVNFFIMISPGNAGALPFTALASVYVPDGGFDVVSDVVRQYPNISVIDVGTLLERVRTIIDRVSLTVRVVFLFTVLAGVLVLLSALRANLGERIHEGAVLRTLGGMRQQLRRAVAAEFAVIGALAGGLSALASLFVGYVVAAQVFQVPYQPSLMLVPAGLLAGAGMIAIIGLLGGREVLTTPPVQVLRRG
ncbi:MAG: FtsX-like permease family protein [Pseudomonadota bacterium]